MSTLCLAAGYAESAYSRRYDLASATTSAAPPVVGTRREYCDCGSGSWYGRDLPFGFCQAQPAMLEIILNDRPLQAPLSVLVSYRNGYYEIEHQDFGLFGCGKTQAEAVEDLVSFLMADYRQYALAQDADLDPVARDLASRYRKLFGREG